LPELRRQGRRQHGRRRCQPFRETWAATESDQLPSR